MAASVAMKGVAKRFGAVRAVDRVDLDVPAGEFVALLGPSGCGKTTTLRMIAGLEAPSEGDILVDGRRVNDIPVHKRNFGMVFQDLALFPHKTVFDNIAFGLRYRGVSRSEIERRVRHALDIVRLPQVGDRLPKQLSGGQQQRVAVARAVVIEPSLLLFDEPLSALDANLREEMRIELKRIHRELGITTVFVTHDQAEALSMADRVVVMHDGRVEQQGRPDQLYQRPRTEFVARFFGHVNEVTGTVERREGGLAHVRIEGGHVVTAHGVKAATGQRVRLLLRAERLGVARPYAGDASASVLQATIVSADYLGLLARYIVEANGLQLVVIQPAQGAMLAPGEAVTIRIPPEAWMTF